MSTERFTRKQFEEALFAADTRLANSWTAAFVDGEWRYSTTINNPAPRKFVKVFVNSSIDTSGFAADNGENSIRVWFADGDGSPLGNKITRWTTRQPGWEKRLADVLDQIVQMAEAIQFCLKCHTLEKVFVVKKEGANKGRLFIKCECPNSFSWLDFTDEPAKPQFNQAVADDLKMKQMEADAERKQEEEAERAKAAYKKAVESPQPVLRPEDTQLVKLTMDMRNATNTTPSPVYKQDVAPKCPKCGAEMRLRTRKSDNSRFWGCSRWPDCNWTVDYGDEQTDPNWKHITDKAKAAVQERVEGINKKPVALPIIQRNENKVAKAFEPSKYQAAIFNWVDAHVNVVSDEIMALMVEAGPGSGKTTTGVQMLKRIPKNHKVLFMAFNKHIAKKLQSVAPSHVMVRTYHALGLAACTKALGDNMMVEDEEGDKIRGILESILDRNIYKHLFGTITSIISLVKATLSGVDDADLEYLVNHFNIEINDPKQQALVFEATRKALIMSKEQTSIIDYDDMCWLPVINDWPMPQFDDIFLDEYQDTNKCQMALAMMAIKKGGRIIAVGDRHQSLYGFRGADITSIPTFIDAFKADVLPLSITYRNPKSHVRLLNQKFPDWPLEAAEWAIEGVIRTISENQAASEYKEGDLVLCRTNAPLMAPAFACIRRGIKATVRGRSFGKELINMIKKFKCFDTTELIQAVSEYSRVEVAKLQAAEKKSQAQILQDKCDTIIVLCEGVALVSEVENKIKSIFDDNTTDGVVFSTVHRAKGEEAERVYILRPDLMPHPAAQQDWEIEQEQNIEWVAYSRSLNEMIFVQ